MLATKEQATSVQESVVAYYADRVVVSGYGLTKVEGGSFAVKIIAACRREELPAPPPSNGVPVVVDCDPEGAVFC